jgi:uncharacterized protein
MRVLVLILLVVLVVWLIKRALRGSAGQEVKQKAPVEGELVRCTHCGVHLPRSEARMAESLLYCSDEHARLGKR